MTGESPAQAGSSRERNASEPSGERLTFVGHSTVLFEIGGARILTDPVLRDRVLHIRRHAEPAAPDVAQELDAILISHLHPDHLDFPSLRKASRDTPIFAPAGSGQLLRRRGFSKVVEVAPGDSARIANAELQAIAVAHDGRRYSFGPPIPTLGYTVRGASSVFIAGDTAPFDTRSLTGLDVALLPIAGWGPHLRTAHHLDPRTAAEAAAEIRPRAVVPIHWGTMLRLGLGKRAHDLLVRPAEEFAAHVAELAPGVEARILEPGEAMSLQ